MKLVTLEQMQEQTQRLTEFLESEDWQLDDGYYTYGKIYKNLSPYIKISGVNSIENVTVEGKAITVPSANFNAATPVTLASNGNEILFGNNFNLQLEGKKTTITPNDKNATISNFHQDSDAIRLENYTTTVTDTIEGGNATLTLTNGDTVSTILLEDVDSGTVKFKIEDYSASYVIGSGFSDYVVNTDSGVTLSISNDLTAVNLANNVTISVSGYVDHQYVKATIDNSGNNVSIRGYANNDYIVSTGDYVTINTSSGKDTISLGAAAQNNSIYGGTGNDLIFGSPDMGHTYVYNKGDGNDTIVNFTASDVLQINGDYTTENTAAGFKINVGAYSVLLKGTLKSGATEGSNTVADYDTIQGGTVLQIVDSTGETIPVEVPKLILGTYSNDSINVVAGKHDNHTINAANGADYIESNANSVLINGGAGNDSIKITGGENVTVVGGYNNDSIVVAHAAASIGQLFEFQLDGSTDILEGVNANDTIKITGAGDDLATAIKSESYDEDGYLVLKLKDNSTVIKIKESNGTVYQKPHTSVKTFYIQLNDGTPVTYNIPNIKNVTGTTAVTLQTTADDRAIVIGNYEANKILNTSATNVSIYGGGGADSINVKAAAGSNNTIYAGTGDDTIILEQAGQIIQYKTIDDNDTIFGWQDDDTLQLLDTTSYSTVMSGKTFGIKVGDYVITLYKDTNYTNLVAGVDVVKVLDSNGTLETITVPKVIGGTSDADSINNADSNYSIYAGGGDDTISNTGANVYIEGGSGADSVKTSGNNVTVIGVRGNDTVIASGGSNVSIDGGTGDDFISLAAGVSGATVNGGEGLDTIYSSGGGNVFVRERSGENELILGFSVNDSIKLGAGVTPSLSNGEPIVKNSSEGTKLYLSDGTYIQMKGTKKAGATGNELSDFDIVPGTNITIIQSDNTTVAATIPMTKYTGNTGDLFINADSNYTIIGTTSIENINNSGDNVTINTGKSNDNIINSGKNVSINAGSNDDVILIGDGYDRAGDFVSVGSNAQNVTIYGGAGNDTIYGNSSGGHVYQFKINEGTDDIYNFSASDTIEFVNSASLPSYAEIDTDDTNFKDFQFTFGTGIITLKKLPIGRTVNYKLSQSQGAVTVTGGS